MQVQVYAADACNKEEHLAALADLSLAFTLASPTLAAQPSVAAHVIAGLAAALQACDDKARMPAYLDLAADFLFAVLTAPQAHSVSQALALSEGPVNLQMLAHADSDLSQPPSHGNLAATLLQAAAVGASRDGKSGMQTQQSAEDLAPFFGRLVKTLVDVRGSNKVTSGETRTLALRLLQRLSSPPTASSSPSTQGDERGKSPSGESSNDADPVPAKARGSLRASTDLQELLQLPAVQRRGQSQATEAKIAGDSKTMSSIDAAPRKQRHATDLLNLVKTQVSKKRARELADLKGS